MVEGWKREEKPGKRGVGKRGGYPMSVTAAVVHCEMSPLNEDAFANMNLRGREGHRGKW